MADTITVSTEKLLLAIRESQRRAEADMDGERSGRVHIPELLLYLECLIVNRTVNDPPSPMWLIDTNEKGSTLVRRYHEDSILRALESIAAHLPVPDGDENDLA